MLNKHTKRTVFTCSYTTLSEAVLKDDEGEDYQLQRYLRNAYILFGRCAKRHVSGLSDEHLFKNEVHSTVRYRVTLV